MSSPTETTIPRIGQVATVRNRRGIISQVRPSGDAPEGQVHLVDVEYNDGDTPLEESLVWEREPFARLLPPSALPEPGSSDPMPTEDLVALERACRWSARMPFLDPDGSGPLERLPASSPFHGAVQIEDYQLVPLLKALRMPRISLLIADDVGLGKTIEAGLIVTELILRRRVRRVLIVTPASLRQQWRDEMWEKFSLGFEVVDRSATLGLRRQMGLDANPWRSHSRIITSYHYLKQANVLEEFRSASQPEGQTSRLPWDLLIVDEAHNLTPSPFGEESELCTMLRHVAPLFEHRLFLTATPHNGHTRSFTGLLEMLDPVRFSQTDELKTAEKARVQDVLIRRLKRQINARKTPKPFCDRLPPSALLVRLGRGEKAISNAFSEFRSEVRSIVAASARRKRLAGTFAVEILGKRLLSSPTAFADSWLRVRAGMKEDEDVTEGEVLSSKKAVDDEGADDREAESLRGTAAATVGAWLRPMADQLQGSIRALDEAVAHLGFSTEVGPLIDFDPKEDVRYVELRALIEKQLQRDGDWQSEERLVVFTEYKTTLDYLVRRLRADLGEPERILSLFGGMDDPEREDMKAAFNDPADAVRILVATDAASEGLNLQETARYLLHYDVPWNPARLEQRNGRIDRHGQARDVQVWHFASDDDHDLAFLSHVVRKVDSIREDLGATGEVFDELTHRRLIDGESLDAVRKDLDSKVDAARKAVDIPADDQVSPEEDDGTAAPTVDLEALAREMDFGPEPLRTTLDASMAIKAGRPRIGPPDEQGRCEILHPDQPGWGPVIDDTVRLPTRGARVGRMRKLTFDSKNLIISLGGRPVFRPRKDTLLVHLGHPLILKSLSTLTRQRFPGAGGRSASRWSVRRGPIPEGADALLLVTVEELAINELRETFHHWVRTLRFPVRAGRLGALLDHEPASSLRPEGSSLDKPSLDAARDLWDEVSPDVRKHVTAAAGDLTASLRTQLEEDKAKALDEENARYQSRQGEVSALIETSTMAKLERELADKKRERAQGKLFDRQEELDRLERDIELRKAELSRRKQHLEEVRTQLARERERILKDLIPRRYSMRGEAQVLPITVEVVFPGGVQ